ncbi:MAG: O-antigen ligase family protein [Methylocella sp.]
MTISAAISIAPESWSVLLNIAKYFAYMIVMADMTRDLRRLRIALAALAGGLCLQLLMMMLQLITGSDLNISGSNGADVGRLLIFEQGGGLHFRRPSGFLPHPNVFADYLTFVLPPLVALAFAGPAVLRWIWWLALALLVAALGALVLTLSRGGWIAFGCAMLFLAAAGWQRGVVRGPQLAGLALGIAISGAVLVAIFPAAIYRVTQSDQRSSDSRLAMMKQAFLIIRRNPVVGVGLAGYNKAAQTNIPSSFATLLPAFRESLLKGVVHNKYLLTFAETGVVGLALLLGLLGSLAIMPFASFPGAQPARWLVLLGLSGAVVAQAVFFLFDHFSYDLRLGMLFAMAGVMLGVSDQLKHFGNRNAYPPSRSRRH